MKTAPRRAAPRETWPLGVDMSSPSRAQTDGSRALAVATGIRFPEHPQLHGAHRAASVVAAPAAAHGRRERHVEEHSGTPVAERLHVEPRPPPEDALVCGQNVLHLELEDA